MSSTGKPSVQLKYTYHFRSPKIDQTSTHALISSSLRARTGSVFKLYLDYDKKYGYLYSDDKNIINDLKAVNEKNNLMMNFSNTNTMNTSNGSEQGVEEITAVSSNKYDLFGNQVSLVDGDDGSAYVAVNDLGLSGYKLFDEDISSSVVDQLKHYLHMQASIFLNLQNKKLKPQAIDAIINGIAKEVVPVSESKVAVYNKSNPLKLGVATKVTVSQILRQKSNAFMVTLCDDENNGNKSEEIRIAVEFTSLANISIAVKTKLSITPTKQYEDGTYLVTAAQVVTKWNSPMPSTQINHRPAESKMNNEVKSLKSAVSEEPKMEPETPKPLMSKTVSPEKPEKPVDKNAPTVPVTNVSTVPNVLGMRSKDMLNKFKKFASSQNGVRHFSYENLRFFVDFMSGQSGTMQCAQTLEDKKFIAFFLTTDYVQDAEDLDQIEVEESDRLLSVEIGDLVIAKVDEILVRAVILSKKPDGYRVAKFDYAELGDSNEFYKFSDRWMKVPVLIAVSKAPPGFNAEVDKTYDFVSTANNEFVVDNVKFECRRWLPKIEGHPTATSAPKEIKVEQKVVTTLPKLKQTLKVGEVVQIIQISEDNVYLRTKNFADTLKRIQTIQRSDVQALEKPPVVGQIVLILEEYWKRARIEEFVSENSVLVDFIDYKNQAEFKLDRLWYAGWTADEEACLFAKKLKGCATITPEIMEKLKPFLKKRSKVTHHVENEVDLKFDDVPSLSEFILKKNFPTFDDLPLLEVDLKTELTGLIFNCVDKYIVKFAVWNEHTEKVVDLSEFESQPAPKELHLNELCLIYHEGQLYRAQVTKVDGDKVEVYLFDSGSTEVVAVNKTKVFPEALLKFPPIVITGNIKDVPNVDSMNVTADCYYAVIDRKNEDGTYYFTQLQPAPL